MIYVDGELHTGHRCLRIRGFKCHRAAICVDQHVFAQSCLTQWISIRAKLRVLHVVSSDILTGLA